MAGALSKSAAPMTPAMQASQKATVDKLGNYMKTWMPVHRYFAQRVEQDAPGLKDVQRGQAGADATAAGGEQAGVLTGVLANRGASAGSGRSVMALADNANNTAAGVASGMTSATSAADRSYVSGLQKAMSLGQAEQSMALNGINAAAQASNAEQSQYESQRAAEQQGYGQLTGLAGGLAGKAVKSPAPVPKGLT